MFGVSLDQKLMGLLAHGVLGKQQQDALDDGVERLERHAWQLHEDIAFAPRIELRPGREGHRRRLLGQAFNEVLKHGQ